MDRHIDVNIMSTVEGHTITLYEPESGDRVERHFGLTDIDGGKIARFVGAEISDWCYTNEEEMNEHTAEKKDKPGKMWILAISNSAADGIKLLRFDGTKRRARSILMKYVRESRANDKESFNYGTRNMHEIDEESDGAMLAYNVFSDYHIDYTVIPLANIPTYG